MCMTDVQMVLAPTEHSTVIESVRFMRMYYKAVDPENCPSLYQTKVQAQLLIETKVGMLVSIPSNFVDTFLLAARGCKMKLHQSLTEFSLV